MMKKIFYIFLILLIFGCKTVDNVSTTRNGNSDISKGAVKDKEMAKFDIIHQKLSEHVLASSDPYYSDYASLVLSLLADKNWDELSFLTDNVFYDSYVTESSGSLVDYCMFMLHTGDKGISTNYSLNELKKAYYTGSIIKENGIIYEGLYLFPSGETEYFKILIQDDENGLILTRE